MSPFTQTVYIVSLPDSELRRTITTKGHPQDGSELTVEAAYTLVPQAEGLWRVVDVGSQVAIECDQLVKSTLTKRLKQFMDWQEALRGEEELEAAAREVFKRGTYRDESRTPPGFILSNFIITDIRPSGELGSKSLMSLSKEAADFRKELRAMDEAVRSLAELDDLRDSLLDKYQGNKARRRDILDWYNRTKDKLREPR